MKRSKTALVVLLGLVISLSPFVTGCGGDRSISKSDQTYPSESYVVVSTQSPVKLQTVISVTRTEKMEQKKAETANRKTGESQQNKVERPGTDQTEIDGANKEVKSTTTKEKGSDTQDISFFLRPDGNDDDNVAALLTPDYLRQFDIPIVLNDAVQFFVKYFTTDKRKIFVNWLKRSRRYVPMIKSILRDQGMPEDLVYVAMIESGFNPKAYSSAKACGPWQFIYETGGRYGLHVTHWADERRDPEKSTLAAALYLKDLFNQFGCWYLAAAGYNAGEKRIERAIEKHETTDFWELSKYNTLPRETREYIPRLLAAAIIAKDPDKFGLTNIEYDSPVRFVKEKVPGGSPLEVLAKAASTDVIVVRALNPELLTGITPPDAETYTVKLPESIDRERFRSRLNASLEREKRVENVVAYTLKRKDNLKKLSKKYGVTFGDLTLVNNCEQKLDLRPGRVVFIPQFEGRKKLAKVEESVDNDQRVVEAPPKVKVKNRMEVAQSRRGAKPLKNKDVQTKIATKTASFHIVKRGENLTEISEKYGVDVATLKQINRLKQDHLRPNMRIVLTSERKVSKKSASAYHKVKKGETLTGIADRYDMEVATLKELNGLKESKIHSGMKLKISDSSRTKPSKQG